MRYSQSFPKSRRTKHLGLDDSAQLQDLNLTQTWMDVQVIEGQRVSQVSFPHFMVKNKLLCQVTQKMQKSVNSCLSPENMSQKCCI